MIEFRDVSKTYPGSAAPAVERFSHSVTKGSTTCFVGPSGCGKTTLLRTVNRMVAPDEGSVFVRGEDVADSNPVQLRRSIGYVMQHSGLMPHRTVLDNVADIASLSGASKGEAKQRAAETLELVNLDNSLYGRYPAELSGGQAQRVGVARGMVTRPDILIMDEPFGAVDPVVRRSLQREVASLKERLSTTILFVTHDVDEAFLLGDQVVILGPAATIEQAGSPADIVAHPAGDAVREFIGAQDWSLSTVHRDGETLVVDAAGRIKGVLS
ncbi:ATP-binding cassette domain-containing protein [Corynebacterium capitovis]|uniref:ATP-binding cassette domain-containing protein n=1 Tax=Corynebacterium capitovis TaxID=131081 RepID=UPI00037579B6|nr:ATP-binding cassette domain-containing protein [Corynebacterium capitovis]